MSYIIEALKKAQKERDSRLTDHADILKGTTNRSFLKDRILWFAPILCLVILLVFAFYSWLDRPDDEKIKTSHINPVHIKTTEKKIDREDIYEKAGMLYRSGRYQEAKKLYEAVLGLDPGHVEALNNLGVIYIRDKDYLRAEENFEKAVLLKPSYSEPYYNLACLYSIRGEIDRSLAYLKKAAGLNGNVVDWARNDSDLQGLWELEEFKKISSD